MTAVAATILRLATPRHQCRDCPTIIPADRELCYFHSRPPPPEPVPEKHPLCHVPDDLRPLFHALLEPLTLTEIAQELGVTRRVADYRYERLRHIVGMPATLGSPNLDRLAMLRVSAGLDPCFCGL